MKHRFIPIAYTLAIFIYPPSLQAMMDSKSKEEDKKLYQKIEIYSETGPKISQYHEYGSAPDHLVPRKNMIIQNSRVGVFLGNNNKNQLRYEDPYFSYKEQAYSDVYYRNIINDAQEDQKNSKKTLENIVYIFREQGQPVFYKESELSIMPVQKQSSTSFITEEEQPQQSLPQKKDYCCTIQ